LDLHGVLRWLTTFGTDGWLRRTVTRAVPSREIALRVKREEERRLLR
jgi:hypothetical protein